MISAATHAPMIALGLSHRRHGMGVTGAATRLAGGPANALAVATHSLSTWQRDMRTYGPRNVGHLDLTAKAAASRGVAGSPDTILVMATKWFPSHHSSGDRLGIHEPRSIEPRTCCGQGRVRDRIKGLAVARFNSPIPEPADGIDPRQSMTGGVLIPSMVMQQRGESEAGRVQTVGVSAPAFAALLTNADPDAERMHVSCSTCGCPATIQGRAA